MARTINFDFAQGGGSILTNGKVTLAGTKVYNVGSTAVLPDTQEAWIVNGVGTMPNVNPNPSGVDGFHYMVKVASDTGGVFYYIVDVPAGTSAINFNSLPVIESTMLPYEVSGVQLEAWFVSVRAQATAANNNALLALSLIADGGIGGGVVAPQTMVVVNQVGSGYTRPSSDPDIVYVFTGSADPGPVALENDRWDRFV